MNFPTISGAQRILLKVECSIFSHPFQPGLRIILCFVHVFLAFKNSDSDSMFLLKVLVSVGMYVPALYQKCAKLKRIFPGVPCKKQPFLPANKIITQPLGSSRPRPTAALEQQQACTGCSIMVFAVQDRQRHSNVRSIVS